MTLSRLVQAVVLAWSVGAGDVRAAGPPPGPGVDPGGVAIALIGWGVDYRDPAIARRLARDGEGEVIGRDLIANDARPFASASSSPASGGHVDSSEIVRRLRPDAPIRLVPVKTAADELPALARAVAFAAQTPARIIVLPMTALNGPAGELVRQAAQRYRTLLFVVALAEEADRPLPGAGRTGAVPLFRADNLLLVSPAVEAIAEPHDAELMVEVPGGLSPSGRLAQAIAETVSALSCHMAANGRISARETKDAIVARSDPLTATGGRRTLVGDCG